MEQIKTINQLKNQLDRENKLHIYNKINPILFDTSLRDGLQGLNKEEQLRMTTNMKKDIYNNICHNHQPTNIEIGSIVNPKFLPIMSDTFSLYKDLQERNEENNLFVLCPNKRNFNTAFIAGITNFSFITSVSNSFQMKNINKHLRETKTDLQEIMEFLRKQWTLGKQYKTKLYISCINQCPIEGKINNDIIINEILHYNNYKFDELCLADTMGTLSPTDFKYIFENSKMIPSIISLHLHIGTTTYYLQQILEYAFDNQINKFDVSLENMNGGCPLTMSNELKSNLSYELFYSILYNYIKKTT